MNEREQLVIRWDDPALGDVVVDVARRVSAAGGRAWLVGGAVRDAWLGDVLADADLEVHGLAADRLEKIVGDDYDLDLVGKFFAVFKLKGWPVDLSLPRRERKTGPGHRGFDVESDPDLDLATAAARRDFTLNALYCDPLDRELRDPLHGQADLRDRVLRHCSHAFAEDPLRVLRGMQLVARFELEAAAETVTLCRAIPFEDLPTERIGAEWEKLLLRGRTPSRGLRFLADTGWLAHFPELADLDDENRQATGRALDAFAGARIGARREDLVVGLVVLCQAMSIDQTDRFLARLTGEVAIRAEVRRLAAALDAPELREPDIVTDPQIRRLALAVGRLDRLVRAAEAAGEGRGDSAPTPAARRQLLARALALGVADAPPAPILRGRHLVTQGLEPGRRFGMILDACFEAQLDGAFTDEKGGLAHLLRILEENSI